MSYKHLSENERQVIDHLAIADFSILEVLGTSFTFVVYNPIALKNEVDMPRKSRVDAPGALHHIIVRRIERANKVFRNDTDRKERNRVRARSLFFWRYASLG